MRPTRRISQRAPLSCYPCSKRKMRCSKTVPCANCVRRGIPEQCIREAVILSKELPKYALGSRVVKKTGTGRKSNSKDEDGSEKDTDNSRSQGGDDNFGSRDSIRTSSVDTYQALNVENNIAPSQVSSLVSMTSRGPASNTSISPSINHNDIHRSPTHGHHGNDGRLTMEAADTLESLVWGSHRATVEVYQGRNRALNISGSLSNEQEKQVLEFHRKHVAWTHNVLHMPTFAQECQKHRQTEYSLPTAGWLSLYYAVLSLSFMYMPPERANRIGLPGTHLLAQSFYDLAIESLHAAELATVNSIHVIQAICIILPCCHTFGDSKRIIILLSMAITTAQIMHLHRLDANPTESVSVSNIISREVQKRVWCFLCIQDSYLVASKRSYNIVMMHCTTPLPINYDDDESESRMTELPLDCFTQSTYQLLQFQMTNISRTLFDGVSALERAGCRLQEIFTKVLEADTSMIQFAQKLPNWLKWQQIESGRFNDNGAAAGAGVDYEDTKQAIMQNVRRTLRISFCHKRIMIHRSFFCSGLTDKRFHYSYSKCLDAARIILREYRTSAASSQQFAVDCWTIPAHVICACNVIMLNTVFNRSLTSESFAGDLEFLDGAQDQNLMEDCLALVQGLRFKNKIVERGLIIIRRLMDSQFDTGHKYSSLDTEEVNRLVTEVEVSMRTDDNDLGFDESIFDLFDLNYPI